MQTVQITRNARLQKDDDGLFWLLIDSSIGPAMFSLSTVKENHETGEIKSIGFDEVLEAFMKDQLTTTQH